MIDPSMSSTIECTTDCGWMTTSIWSARHAEQPVRLDHLEPLVHQRRRIDRDLPAHPPGRMLQRVGRRSPLRVPTPARPRNGPPEAVRIEPPHLGAVAAVQALVDGVVLAVDRQDRDAAPARRLGDDAAGHHEHFLVGERDRLAVLDRREHRFERFGAATRRRARGRRRDARRPRRGRRGRCRRSSRRRRRAAAQPIERRRRSPSRRCAAGSARSARRAGRRSRRRRGRRPAADRRCASTTASALWPIEPVDPRMAMRFTARPSRPGHRASELSASSLSDHTYFSTM